MSLMIILHCCLWYQCKYLVYPSIYYKVLAQNSRCRRSIGSNSILYNHIIIDMVDQQPMSLLLNIQTIGQCLNVFCNMLQKPSTFPRSTCIEQITPILRRKLGSCHTKRVQKQAPDTFRRRRDGQEWRIPRDFIPEEWYHMEQHQGKNRGSCHH